MTSLEKSAFGQKIRIFATESILRNVAHCDEDLVDDCDDKKTGGGKVPGGVCCSL